MASIDNYRKALLYLLRRHGRGAQANLAIDADVSAAHINRIKQGTGGASVEVLEKIAKALGQTYEGMLSMGASLPDETGENGVEYKIPQKGYKPVWDDRRAIFVEKSVLDEIPGFGSCIEILNELTKYEDKRPLVKQILREFILPYLDENGGKGGNDEKIC